MNTGAKISLAFVGGVSVGGAIGYFVTNKVLHEKYEAIANEEIESVKETYKLLRKEDEYSDPAKIVESLGYNTESDDDDFIEEETDDVPLFDEDETEESEIVEEEIVNIFDNQEIYNELPEEEIVKEEELEEIHIISEHKFFNDDDEYEKITITYFQGDDTLCDEREVIIPDIDKVVGRKNLSKFGYQSNNEKVVYIRNTWVETDFEVVLDPRRYRDVVIGVEEEMYPPHRQNRVMKMRDDD